MEEKKEEQAVDKIEGLPKKSGSLKTIVLVVGICISSTVGAIFGQAALAKMRPPQPAGAAASAAPPKEAAEPEEVVAETMNMESIICDIRSTGGDLHHVKIGIAVELAKPVPEEEQKKMMPRARDAAISYIRALSYDDVTNNQNFDTLRSELGERVAKALGKNKVSRVLFTEFVVQ